METSMKILRYLTAFCWLLLPIGAVAEDLFVTPNGAGSRTGADWNNAFASFTGVQWGAGTGKLGADDTLWVAGGTYSATEEPYHTIVFQLKGSGTVGHFLNIKRSTIADSACTIAPGWLKEYDSQVIISGSYGIYLSDASVSPAGAGRYINIDGRTIDGIRINTPDIAGGSGITLKADGALNSTFTNIGVYGPSTDVNANNSSKWYNWQNDVQGIRAGRCYPDCSHLLANITFDHMTISGFVTGATLSSVEYITIQYSNIHTIGAPLNCCSMHSNVLLLALCNNFTFRYNNVHDNAWVTGLYFAYSGSGPQQGNEYIYGNIFRDGFNAPNIERAISKGEGTSGDGPYFIYNNTFVNLSYAFYIPTASPLGSTQSYCQNNIFMNIGTPCSMDPHITSDHNILTNSSSIFVNYAGAPPASLYAWQHNRNLHLALASSLSGVTLGAPYSIDADGNSYGADGYWDIGAFEYIATGLSKPANLRIVGP